MVEQIIDTPMEGLSGPYSPQQLVDQIKLDSKYSGLISSGDLEGAAKRAQLVQAGWVYKGYEMAFISKEVRDGDQSFTGLVNLKHMIAVAGHNYEEVISRFPEAMDSYIEWCNMNNIPPLPPENKKSKDRIEALKS